MTAAFPKSQGPLLDLCSSSDRTLCDERRFRMVVGFPLPNLASPPFVTFFFRVRNSDNAIIVQVNHVVEQRARMNPIRRCAGNPVSRFIRAGVLRFELVRAVASRLTMTRYEWVQPARFFFLSPFCIPFRCSLGREPTKQQIGASMLPNIDSKLPKNNQQKQYREDELTDADDVLRAQGLIRDAFPTRRHGNAKAAIWTAYRQLKLNSERRARSIWDATATLIRAHEMTALEQAALRRAQNDYARNERDIARLQAALRIQNPDAYRDLDNEH